MIVFSVLNLAYFEVAIRRTNNISDEYLDSMIKNSWLIGCALGRRELLTPYQDCRDLGERLEWGRLIPDIKRVSK